MEPFFQNLNWPEIIPQVVGQFIGMLLGFIASWFLLFRRRLLAIEDIEKGNTDIVLFQAHMLYPTAGKHVLLFRNACPSTTTQELYHNTAARDEARRLATQTTLEDPILSANGTVGFEVVNGAFSEIAGQLANSPFQREVWLFAMTCEDNKLVRRSCIRCFLIRQPDLEAFADWDWCRNNLLCEKPWHWVRIVTLHRIACQWKDCGPEEEHHTALSTPAKDKDLRYRIWRLSAGIFTEDIPTGDPVVIPWEEHEKALKKLGLDVDTGRSIS